jgi:hypothetical protein
VTAPAPLALDPAVAAALRAGLALLFAAAALHKARDPRAFRDALAAYRVLPPAAAGAAAAAVVAAELAAAALLVAALPGAGDGAWLRRAGGLLAAALLAVYGAAIAANLARGRRDLDCGCLGPAGRQPLSGWLVARNAALAAAALALLLPVSTRALLWPDALTVAGATLLAALVWTAAHQALANALARAAGGLGPAAAESAR